MSGNSSTDETQKTTLLDEGTKNGAGNGANDLNPEQQKILTPPGGKNARFVTAPRDRKNFPSTNQVHYCWQKYNEWVLCLKRSNNNEEKCKLARIYAISICPEYMYDTWDDERERGVFLGVQDKDVLPSLHPHH